MRRGLALFIAFLVPLGSQAQEVPRASAYIDSAPIGARIVLDGQTLEVRTPALLRGLDERRHTVTVGKDGWIPVTQTFVVSEGKVPTVRAALPPSATVVAFPSSDRLVTPQGVLPTAQHQFRYPAGSYILSESDNGVRFTPQFEDEGLLGTAGWNLTTATGALVLSGAVDWHHWQEGNAPKVSLFTIAAGSAALGELVWYGTLTSRKGRFYRETAPQISPLAERIDLASTLNQRADEALQAGDLVEAESRLAQLVRSHPDSSWVPGAWFNLARIHSITGRRELATGEFRLVAESFPQAAYHDRARQALADLAEAAGDPEEALRNLDHLVMQDGVFDPGAVKAQRERLARATPSLRVPSEGTSAHQGYDRTLELFARGHEFSPWEISQWDDLRARLVERGDNDLAANLDLLRGALGAREAAGSTGEDWEQAQAVETARKSWRSARDAAVLMFRLASATALITATVYDRDPTDPPLWATNTALWISGLTMFSVVWSELRQ